MHNGSTGRTVRQKSPEYRKKTLDIGVRCGGLYAEMYTCIKKYRCLTFVQIIIERRKGYEKESIKHVIGILYGS